MRWRRRWNGASMMTGREDAVNYWRRELDGALSEKAALESQISRLSATADLGTSGVSASLAERRLEVRVQQLARTNDLIAFIESRLAVESRQSSVEADDRQAHVTDFG
jgi:hypothetical protein